MPAEGDREQQLLDAAQTLIREGRTLNISLGEVAVSHQVVSYLLRRQPGGEVVGEEPLDLPERTLRTSAVWWTIPSAELEGCGLDPGDLPGAAHAAEHCSIGLLPLFATCDRWDIGGVSTALHPDTGTLTVFVHDGHPGGAGFAERGFHRSGGYTPPDPAALLEFAVESEHRGAGRHGAGRRCRCRGRRCAHRLHHFGAARPIRFRRRNAGGGEQDQRRKPRGGHGASRSVASCALA